jgi:hypothetical protein
MSQSGAEPTAVDLPRDCLGHLRSETSRAAHRAWCVPLGSVSHRDPARPAHGRTTATIVCGTCGRGLSYTVSSHEQIHRDRWRTLGEGLALTAAGAGYITGFWFPSRRQGPGARLARIRGIADVSRALAGAHGGGLIGEVRSVPGARLQYDSDHQLCSPGETVSFGFLFSEGNPAV